MCNRERRGVVKVADAVDARRVETPAFGEAAPRRARRHCPAQAVDSAPRRLPRGMLAPPRARDWCLKVAAVDPAVREIDPAAMSPRDPRPIAFPAESPRSRETSAIAPVRGIAPVAEDRRVAIAPIWERAVAPAAVVARESAARTVRAPASARGQANAPAREIVPVPEIVPEAVTAPE